MNIATIGQDNATPVFTNYELNEQLTDHPTNQLTNQISN